MHIVIEGQDATGKDTQAKLLAEYLRAQGKNVVHYAESGTGSTNPFITEIARLNYGSDQGIDHRTRVMLYLINRYELIKLHKLIMPEPYFHPDKIVFFTLSDEARNKRIGTQTAEAKTKWTRKDEIWKSKGDPFQHKLNHGYLEVAKKFDVPTLDASGTIEEVFEDLKKLFQL